MILNTAQLFTFSDSADHTAAFASFHIYIIIYLVTTSMTPSLVTFQL